jgi:GGDEF domain-containing protein
MFDMDNFKSINEILGYTIGDEFIKTIANTIKNCALKQDNHAYRYGGEEFFIIGKGNNSEKIVEIAEEIQEAISKNPNLSSYSKKYIENIQNKLNLIEPQTSAINQINTLKSQLALIEEFEDSFNKKSKEFTILINKKEEIMSELKFLYNLLLANLEIQANNHANKYVLDKYINELNNPDCDINTFVNNENLNNYLNSAFNKSNKISQLKSWKQDHLDQNGFSTTAAILTYSPDSLLDTTSENIIYNVGEHLKEGKEVKKGKLYIKQV